MAYSSKGRKPIERASKIGHVEIIKNPDVQRYVAQCVLPSTPPEGSLEPQLHELEGVDTSEVIAVIAIDGGYTETFVRDDHPSACLTFFSFGPLLFDLADLRALDTRRFISPEDLHKLKNIERYTLVLPTKGIRHASEPGLAATVRRAVHAFFEQERNSRPERLMDSLRWFLFRRWKREPDDSLRIEIAHCPSGCGQSSISFTYDDPTTKACPSCRRPIYLTDTFRLHERIDEETGGSGICGYVVTMLEQLVLVQLIHHIWTMKRSFLRNILFIKDGPLAFFGLVAPLYKPMRELVEYLLSEPWGASGPTLRIAGLEKHGAFVEHAAAIQDQIPPGSFLLVGDAYIRRYIVPGGDGGALFGENTYWGQKVLFRAQSGEMYVATLPGKRFLAEPTPADIPHLHLILTLIGELRCSMYDNALIPVALANKLVSLSDFPSQRILTTFARRRVQG
jgi:hypothetical protein